MLFTEPPFFLLLLGTFVCYYAVRAATAQILILVAASFIFYAWYLPALLALLLSSITLNALFSFLVVRSTNGERRAYFLIAITLNLAILASFKYAGLIANNLAFLTPAVAVAYVGTIPLPIGISFYTFEGISLATDTYRGTYAERVGRWRDFLRHLRDTSLFIAFFPHLIAGPILKANQFMPQIRAKRIGDIDVTAAARTLIMGYFLKTVLADNLASQTGLMSYPYYIYTSSLNLAAMLIAYSCQILADFAGYSSIAIGLGLLFGYRLPVNFNWPYISRSFSEFWRRWHISLSTWLRDYLYFPLGGSRLGTTRTQLNLLIVMALGGLWHGAAWNYAVWGLWHGGALVVERPFLENRFYRSSALPAVLCRIVLVFSVVTAGWLLFRMPSFGQVKGYLRAIAGNLHVAPNLNQILVIILLSLPLVGLHVVKFLQERGWAISRSLVTAAYGVMIYLLLTNTGPTHAFIYFQF